MNILKNYLRWDNLPLEIRRASHGCGRDNPPHRHDDFFELVIVREGNGCHVLDGVRHRIGAGDVFGIFPGVPHCYESSGGIEIYNILFDLAFLDNFQHDLSGESVFQLLFRLRPGHAVGPEVLTFDDRLFPEVVRLLDGLIAEEEKDEPGGRTAVLSGGLRLFLLICRNCRPARPERGVSNACRISTVLAALDERFGEAWPLRRLARLAGMSESAFRQYFRQLTGMPPIEYLLRLRLAKAAAMLALGRRGIGEIASGCGFADSNYFSRQFRRRYGHSPRDYRKRRDS